MEAPESVEEMRAFCAAAPNTPKMANIIEGGRTPALPPSDLAAVGFAFSIFSVTLLSAAVGAMNRALADLRAGRPAADVVPFPSLCAAVGFPEYNAEADRYALEPPPPPAQPARALSPVRPARPLPGPNAAQTS
jgi:2-methylisocitrate lyase-like PEP mutase family enzyme